MRYLKHSTKAERVFHEILKELRLPFRHHWLVNGREVDFIVGKLAIDIDGHEQDEQKNKMLADSGYTPIHLDNREVLNNKNLIKENIYAAYSTQS